MTVVDLSALGPLGQIVSENNGESLAVHRINGRPGLLLKEFKPGVFNAQDIKRIDGLIELRTKISASDLALIERHTCWPVMRITNGAASLHGVVIPAAPSQYWTTLPAISRTGKPKPLEIDWLATAASKCQRRNIPVPNFDQRLAICESLVAVAEFMERHGLVYGDWSYSNALWSPAESTGYLIDVDRCSMGSGPRVRTPNWDEPATGAVPADKYTDRYGVTLLVARCLTGSRDAGEAKVSLRHQAVDHNCSYLADYVLRCLDATDRTSRPEIAELLAMLRIAQSAPEPGGSGVVGWQPIASRATRPATAGPITTPLGTPGLTHRMTIPTKPKTKRKTKRHKPKQSSPPPVTLRPPPPPPPPPPPVWQPPPPPPPPPAPTNYGLYVTLFACALLVILLFAVFV